jgi:hypothetical protein
MRDMPAEDLKFTQIDVLRLARGSYCGVGGARLMRRTLSARRRSAKGPEIHSARVSYVEVTIVGTRSKYLGRGQRIRELGCRSRQVRWIWC